MGYDMYIENTPDDEAAKAAAADSAYWEAVKARDDLPSGHPDHQAAQAKVLAAQKTADDADTEYFRLNIWSMSDYRQIMHQLGMVVDGYSMPPFPPAPDGITYEDIEAAEAPSDGTALPVKPEAVAYVKQRDAHLAWHPDPAFGIPLHKFGSNDGWLVTPEEIAAALEAYRTHSGDEVKVIATSARRELGYWLKWIAYLERARQRGGFRVW